MFKPWISAWFGLIAGIFLGFTPWSLALIFAMLVYLLCLNNFSKRLIFALFCGIGLLRSQGDQYRWSSSSAADLVAEGSAFDARLKVSAQSSSSLTGEITVFVGENISKFRVRLGQAEQWKKGHCYQLRARLLPLAVYEEFWRIPKELQWRAQNLAGRLKLENSAQDLGDCLSLREKFRDWLSSKLEGSSKLVGGFRRSFFLGAGDGISPENWSALNQLGLSHLIVISGSHLALIIFIFGLVLKSFFLLPWHSPLLKILSQGVLRYRLLIGCLLAGFGWICDLEPSLIRALIFFYLIKYLSLYFPALKRYSNSSILALTGILALIISPLSLTSPSYALSYGATWGLFASHSNEHASAWKKILNALAPFSMTIPLLKAFGYPVHWLSPIANFLFVPFFLGVLIPASLLGVFFEFFDHLFEKILQFFFLSIHFFSELSNKWSLFDHEPPLWALIFFFACLGSLENQKLSLKATVLSQSGIIFLFFLSLWIFPTLNREPNHHWLLETLDVGHGDAFLLKFEDQTVMIDGGGSNSLQAQRQLFPFLLEKTQNRIDLWIISHFDKDHVANFLEILPRLDVREVWISRWDDFKASKILQSQALLKVLTGSQTRCFKEFCLESWAPSAPKHAAFKKVSNSESLVTLFRSRSSLDILAIATGDLPASGELKLLSWIHQQGLTIPKQGVEVLKVGHHGSKTASRIEFLEALRPKTAILLGGRGNSYGLPHDQIIERLESNSQDLLRTDLLGSFNLGFHEKIGNKHENLSIKP